jgi:hypothetical protein
MAFADFRKNATYYLFGPHLEKDENILYVVHRHPFLMFKNGLKIAALHFFLPIFLWNVFAEIWFVFLVWLIYGIIAMNKMIFNWYFDAILITDMSLIDVTWNGPFDRNSVRLEYSMIEGTSYSFKGILQTLFNYGTVQINRQGGATGFELKDAVNPSKVESVILNYQEKYLANKNMEDVGALKNLLTEMIRKHAKELKEIEVDF